MKLAEFCNTAPSYIGEIEIGRKFPSTEMIEKIARGLRIEPYHLFINRAEISCETDIKRIYPLLPTTMKNEIKSQIESSISEIFKNY
ncbi:MAG: helix-turn-helix transcriptional regulator [Treponema sp.]|nr:helix-turn-helix transcriptional regulator [Treponema sp.]